MADFDKNVTITVVSDRCNAMTPSNREKTEFKTSGHFISKGGHITLIYDDSELLDGNQSRVEISFDASAPETVTMLRHGDISTAMVFEKNRIHTCKYETPYMPFDLNIHTKAVDNRLLILGLLNLDYIMEIGGINSEQIKLSIFIC